MNLEEVRGFNSYLKEKYLPKSKTKSRKQEVIVDEYMIDYFKKNKNISEQNIDRHLEECILGLYRPVIEAQNTITNNYYTTLELKQSDYPELYKNRNNRTYMIKPLMELGTSLSQSRKSRAGNTFEIILKHFFIKLNLKFEKHKEIEDEIADFVCPNQEYVTHEKRNAMLLECQTTLKDRFRLTQGKALRALKTKKYLVTATGKEMYWKGDSKDLSLKKIYEYIHASKNKNNYFVVFPETKDNLIAKLEKPNKRAWKKKFDDDDLQRIITFSKFITDYKENQRSWET